MTERELLIIFLISLAIFIISLLAAIWIGSDSHIGEVQTIKSNITSIINGEPNNIVIIETQHTTVFHNLEWFVFVFTMCIVFGLLTLIVGMERFLKPKSNILWDESW